MYFDHILFMAVSLNPFFCYFFWKNIHPWFSQRLSYNGYNSVSFLNFDKMKVALDSLCPCAYFATWQVSVSLTVQKLQDDQEILCFFGFGSLTPQRLEI